MALLHPLHRGGSSFELLLSSSTWSHKALQSSAVSCSHTDVLSHCSLQLQCLEHGVKIRWAFLYLAGAGLPGGWWRWRGRGLELRGEVVTGLGAVLHWSELLRTPTVPLLLHWLVTGILSEPRDLEGSVFSVLFSALLQGHSKYGGTDWNFWQLSFPVTVVNYLSIGLSYPFVSSLSNYILYLQVTAGMLTFEHTGSFSVQYKNKVFCGNRSAWYW